MYNNDQKVIRTVTEIKFFQKGKNFVFFYQYICELLKTVRCE